MAEPTNLPHPQKLYSALRAHGSAEARATAIFEFMCSSTGAESGFLFLPRGDALVCSAGSSLPPPAALSTEVNTAWNRELDRQPEDNNMDKTLDIKALDALRLSKPPPALSAFPYERRMLSIYRGPRWVPIGIAMLKARAGKALLPMRQVHIAALCNALLDAGDVIDHGKPALPRSG
jgi:hypothetical protein